MVTSKSSKGKFTPTLMRGIFWALVGTLLVTVGICIWQYPEKYEFFGETISNLGGIFSGDDNRPNGVSRWVFTGGFCLIALVSVGMIYGYITSPKFYRSGLKASILLIFLLGSLGVAVPYDHPTLSEWHLVGTAMFVASFGVFNFVCQLLRYIRKHRPKPEKKLADYYLDMVFVILVFISLVWYLLSGLMDISHVTNPTVQMIFDTPISQKFLLMVGCVAGFLLDKEDM